MDRLRSLYDKAFSYPKSLNGLNNYAFLADACFQELERRSPNLFCTPPKASIQLWQCRDPSNEFAGIELKNASDVDREFGRTHLRHLPEAVAMPEPASRFIFILAPHSLDRLKITKDMFTKVLTHLQVMLPFLDFVFCFGLADSPDEGFYYGGFREECHLVRDGHRLEIPALGRSGVDIQLCYSLRSADFRFRDGKWSLKPTAIHHSMDLTTGAVNWIMLRGDNLMKDRIISATGSEGPTSVRTFSSLATRLTAALETHLLFCEISTANWRWYLDDLQKTVQGRSQAAQNDPVPTLPASAGYPSPRSTFRGRISEKTYTGSPPQAGLFTGLLRRVTGLLRYNSKATDASSLGEPDNLIHCGDPSSSSLDREVGQEDVSFDKLQDIEALEEQANTALLVLKTNCSTIGQLAGFYAAMCDCSSFPDTWGNSYKASIAQFIGRLQGLQCELQHQQARMETILRTLGDRKALMHGIIQFRTTSKMEEMTADMAEIARKTQQETVSMKIITLVTLFFLPGTFISTLMSTDIIHFQRGEEPAGPTRKEFSAEALKLFFEITGPMMFITFAAWSVFYWWVNYRHKLCLRARLSQERYYPRSKCDPQSV